MKRIIVVLLIGIVSFYTHNLKAQSFIPLALSVNPDSFNVAFYGGFSLDKGSEPNFIKSLSNTGQSGFVVNALYYGNKHNMWFQQFMIDINPIIINWDPFTWNKLISQPVDSFYVQKVPFAQDAFLHIGWHISNFGYIWSKTKDEYRLLKLFNDLYYRPYSIDKNGENYRFAAFNYQTGLQFGYVQKNLPTLGNFMIALSAQMNFLFINEQDGNINNFTTLTNYTDKNFWGPGFKLSVQINNLNIYIDGRQYFGMKTDEKFTQDMTVLVGAFGNVQWLSRRKAAAKNKKEVYY